MEKINTDGYRARLWSHSAHTRAMCLGHFIYFTWFSSHPRTKILTGNRPWGITEGKFFTFYKIMRAHLHAVMLNGLYFFFSFFAHSIQGVQWGETTAFSHIIGPHVEFMYPVFSSECCMKPKAHIRHTIHKQQRWANLITTIIIPTIPQEWKYNTSKNISSTRTVRGIWLYWK